MVGGGGEKLTLRVVAKHADAHQVHVVLSQQNKTVYLSVEDDGKGFNAETLISGSDHHAGLGLQNMQERLELLEGRLEIESSPAKGTRLVASIPLHKKQ